MFSSRLVPSKRIYEQFFSIEDTRQGPRITTAFPENYEDEIAQKILQFVFPCKHRSELVEEYTMIFTNSVAQLEFLACRYLPKPVPHCLCIYSCHPWYEILHYILSAISSEDLRYPYSKNDLHKYLTHIRVLPLPNPGNCLYLPTLDLKVKESKKFMVPSTSHPQFHIKYLYEFYNALDADLWIDIFTSLLLERRIIFHSTRLQRLSACILSAVSLLYPLDWVQLVYPILPVMASTVAACPAPFIAGVHTCLIESLLPDLCEDTRVVDLDKKRTYVTGPYPEGLDLLPKCLVNFLRHKIRDCHIDYEKNYAKSPSGIFMGLENYIRKLSQVFLQGLVAILGGYHDALVADRSGQFILNKDLFVKSRGPEMRNFLDELYHSQMIQDFLNSRVEAINAGIRIQDAFEEEISRYDTGSLKSALWSQNLFCAVHRSTKKLTNHSIEKIQKLTKQSRSQSLDNLKGKSERKSSLPPKPLVSNSADLLGSYDIDFDTSNKPSTNNWRLMDDPDLQKHFPINYGSLPAEAKNMTVDAKCNLSPTRRVTTNVTSARNMNISLPMRNGVQPGQQYNVNPKSALYTKNNMSGGAGSHDPQNRNTTSSAKTPHVVPSLNARNNNIAVKPTTPSTSSDNKIRKATETSTLSSSNSSPYAVPRETSQTSSRPAVRSQAPLPPPPRFSTQPHSESSISFTPRLNQSHNHLQFSSSSNKIPPNSSDCPDRLDTQISPTISDNSKSIQALLEKWRNMESETSYQHGECYRGSRTLPRNLSLHTSNTTNDNGKTSRNRGGIAAENIRKFEQLSGYISDSSTYADCFEPSLTGSQSESDVNDDSSSCSEATLKRDSPEYTTFALFLVPSESSNSGSYTGSSLPRDIHTDDDVEYNFTLSSKFRENGDFDLSESTLELYPTPAKRKSVDYDNLEFNNNDYRDDLLLHRNVPSAFNDNTYSLPKK